MGGFSKSFGVSMGSLGTILNQIGSLVGILPTNTASQNVAAFNAALAKGNLTVDTVGTYEIDDTIFIPSNRTLTFVSGCTLKKKTGSSFLHAIVNKGILTRTYNSNIKIIGNGLTIDTNNIYGNQIVRGMQGHLALFQVNGFEISGITITGSDNEASFSIHLAEVYGTQNNHSVIKDIDITSLKDGLHFGAAQYIDMFNIATSTTDDAIALNAWDWLNSNPSFGDIKDINITNWTDRYVSGTVVSQAMRLLGGSWKVWQTNTTYQMNDPVVNNGRIYQKVSAGNQVSIVPPTHTTGDATGADGITWGWKQDGTITKVDIKNINIVNPIWQSNRALISTTGQQDENQRIIFPGTFGNNVIDNITIDNPTVTPYSRIMFIADVNMGLITYKNFTSELNNNILFPQARAAGNAVTKVLFDNCNLTLKNNTQLIAFSVPISAYTVNEIEFLNSHVITPDATKMEIITLTTSGILSRLKLNNSIFDNISYLFAPYNKTGFNINITANGTSFINKIKGLINLQSVASSVINFTADQCTFEEPELYLFKNDNVTSEVNVITTNSLGESIPNLKSGTVNTGGSDLLLTLGKNILINGKFRTGITGWGCERGFISWNSLGYLTFISDSTAGNKDIYTGLQNPLSQNIEITFRAKSPTATNTLAVWDLSYSNMPSILNPGLNSDWQNYKFRGSRGGNTGTFFIKLGSSLANGVQIDVDDIQVIQY